MKTRSTASLILSLIFISAIMPSCGGAAKSDSENDTIKTSDSQTAPPKAVEVERLPDTIYASAEKIWFKVEVKDTVVDGRLVSLKDLYADSPSAMTFRNGIYRQGDFNGRLDSVPTGLDVVWRVETELERADTVYGPWGGGSGWTGQPLYVKWSDTDATKLKESSAVKSAFKGEEIIVGSLCGSVYFMDPTTGALTRDPIAVGNAIKGTPSFDPTFNGNLYVGQGTPARRPFGALTINLFSNEITNFFKEDPAALRRWGAYDSSPLRIDRFVFRPAENGSIYKFYVNGSDVELHTVLRYTVSGAAPGIESSMAVYANYGFTGDNHGNILAVNLDTMRPVWHYSLGDDTDASPMVAIEDGEPYVYVGCEIDRQSRGHAVFAKLNAKDGSEVWKITPEGYRHEAGKKHFDGGFYASPLLGQGDCKDLIFTNMVKNTRGQNGVFMAIDRKTGKTAYELPLRCYSWSSPVSFLTPDNKMIAVTCDGAGNVYAIDARKGEILFCQHVGNNFESSPAVVGKNMYIGSRGNGIYKIVFK